MAELLEVAFRYTPGAPTGAPAPGKVRIVAGHIDPALLQAARIMEAITVLNEIRAPIDQLVAVANQPVVTNKLGYKLFAAFGWSVEAEGTPV